MIMMTTTTTTTKTSYSATFNKQRGLSWLKKMKTTMPTTASTVPLWMLLIMLVLLFPSECSSTGSSSSFSSLSSSSSLWNVKQPLAFAAAKKGSNNNSKKKGGAKTTSSTKKGFGTPPPTLNEILNSFPTRMPSNNAHEQICPCQQKLSKSSESSSSESSSSLLLLYKDCCGKLHGNNNQNNCQTMTEVLKSRYTAFAWRNIEYVMATTHETCRDYRDDKIAWAKDLNKGGMFDSFEFVQLQAGPEEKSQHDPDNEGYIEFQVTLRAKEKEKTVAAATATANNKKEEQEEVVISERSKFLRNPETGIWSYASGDVRSEISGLEGIPLNA